MIKKLISSTVLVLTLLISIQFLAVKFRDYKMPKPPKEPECIGAHCYTPTHRQEIWIAVLEWCESGGKAAAINPKDRDNTPSYYWFQFKPETFEKYLLKYELALPTSTIRVMELMKDYELTREIVRRMIGDKDVNWAQEFPDCVPKIGKPPR